MRIEQLEYLLAIENYGSLSKAAESLYMTHSALSIALNKLEKELNAEIFKRTRTGLVPTDFGKKVIESANKIVSEINYIKNEASKVTKTLRIASIATISNNILLSAIINFKKENPLYNVVIDEIYPNDVLKMVADLKVKIGISFFEKNKEEKFKKTIKEYSLFYEPLYVDYLCAYVSKNNSLVQKKWVYEKDIRDCIPVSINHRQRKENKIFYNNFIDNEFDFSFTNQESIKKLIAENNAVAYFPKILSYNDFYVKSGAIVPLDIIDNRQEIIHYIVYSGDLDSVEQCFLKNVKQIYRNLKLN